jgi:pimeloyl-ACP methyl ester carboxylesterase
METEYQGRISSSSTVSEEPVAAGTKPPAVTDHFIQLPKTNLHYIKCGDGPPLIMVPATISKIENWLALAQFMGQRFTVYFFELPGHGKSTPFSEPFSSALAAETIEAFIDHLDYKTVSLMGFSFGGILAMTALGRLGPRVEKIVLLSPALSKRALKFSKWRLWVLKLTVRLFQKPRVRVSVIRLIHGPRSSRILGWLFSKIGRVEKTIPMQEVFRKVTESTADVLSYQIGEMLGYEIRPHSEPFNQPCYFAMSVRDPLLDFDSTLGVLKEHFATIFVERFNYPYHQPPKPLTYEEAVRDHSHLLEITCAPAQHSTR